MRSPALLLVLLVACAGVAAPVPTPTPPAPPAPASSAPGLSLLDVGLEPSWLDPKTDPCDDFYRFACGGWLDASEIPGDKAVYGTFDAIADRNEAILHDILEKAAAAPASDPALQKLGAFYAAC